MLDIKMVREHPEVLDKAQANRQSSWDKERFLSLDEKRRSTIERL